MTFSCKNLIAPECIPPRIANMNQCRSHPLKKPLAEAGKIRTGSKAPGRDENKLSAFRQEGRAYRHEDAVNVGLTVHHGICGCSPRIILADLEIRRITDHQIKFRGVPEPSQHLQRDAFREHEITVLHNVFHRYPSSVRPQDKRVENPFQADAQIPVKFMSNNFNFFNLAVFSQVLNHRTN